MADEYLEEGLPSQVVEGAEYLDLNKAWYTLPATEAADTAAGETSNANRANPDNDYVAELQNTDPEETVVSTNPDSSSDVDVDNGTVPADETTPDPKVNSGTALTGTGSEQTTTPTTTGTKTIVKGSALQSHYAISYDTEIDTYIGNYSGKDGRLTQFINNDGTTEDARIGYLKLIGSDADISAMDSISSTITSTVTAADKNSLNAIYKLLTASSTKYDRFVINSVSENRAEKMSIMKTVGDSFAMTFTGREPLVIQVSGSLVFDYDRTRMSWYVAFMNAYEYYMRASMLAKYRVKLKLVLPDFTIYEGYMVNLAATQAAESDITVPFNFGMVVTNEMFNSAYSNSGIVQNTTNTVVKDTADAANAENLSSGSITPTTDGALAKATLEDSTSNDTTASSTLSNSSKETASSVVKKSTLSKNLSAAKTSETITLAGQALNTVGVRIPYLTTLRSLL